MAYAAIKSQLEFTRRLYDCKTIGMYELGMQTK